MISDLSGGQIQDEVGSGIFFLGVDQRSWLGFEIEVSVASRFPRRDHVSLVVPVSAGVSEGFYRWTFLTL